MLSNDNIIEVIIDSLITYHYKYASSYGKWLGHIVWGSDITITMVGYPGNYDRESVLWTGDGLSKNLRHTENRGRL